ncbi:MAG: site-specific integrase, partial [Bacteroidales bacterium]|nr:site-specific integrase [Bacteroidales bacterium]
FRYVEAQLYENPFQKIPVGWLAHTVKSFWDKDKPVKDPRQDTIFDYFGKFLSHKTLTEGTHRHYAVIIRILRRFEMYKQILEPKYKIRFSGIDVKFLQELEYFIINENKLLKKCPFIIRAIPESRMPGQRGRNTVNGYLKKFKSFVLWAKGEDLMTSNPFRRFKIARDVYGTPYYISLEERHQIEQTDLSSRPKLAIQRDIFVFHCCLGCRVGDLKRLTTANLIDGEIHYIAQKTKAGNPKTIKIPLNETAMAIVKKYADPNRESLLPFISDQKYNYAIKEIFTLAGITRNVVVRNSVTGEQEIRPINEIASSHMARRTFVGNLFKKFKDQSLISELSGHVPNSREFARYREIDSELKREMVSVIE